jgi:hypothetical protein
MPKAVRTITVAEYESKRKHGNAGTFAELLPITQETWRDNGVDATHWMLCLESDGTCLVPINLEG